MDRAGEHHVLESDDSPTERFRRYVPPRPLRAGIVVARDRVDRATFGRSLERALGRVVVVTRFVTYDELADAAARAVIDLAWLPPAAYLRARLDGGVRAVAVLQRGSSLDYRSALLARTGSYGSIDEIRGARAAWVDPWSAAGCLVPRGMLAARGLDLSRAIGSERFFGSYDAALDALTVRTADVAGAFCTVDEAGKIVDRGWTAAAPVKVLALSPPIPADVLCTTTALDDDEQERIARDLTGPEGFAVAQAVGGSALAPTPADLHDALAGALTMRR